MTNKEIREWLIQIRKWSSGGGIRIFCSSKDIRFIDALLAMLDERARLRIWIDAESLRIEKDERYHYEPALVQINAPLALIQLEMETEIAVLKKIVFILSGGGKKEKA